MPRRSVHFPQRAFAATVGTPAHNLIVVRTGWAAKVDLFPDGRRQIFDLLLPGDLANCDELISENSQSSIIALSSLETCQFSRREILQPLKSNPDMLMAFNRICAAYPRRMRELLSVVGRKAAESRVASLILNLHQRTSRSGRRVHSTIPFYLRQQDIADMLGLTQVHVSRVLKTLRDRQIIALNHQELRLKNIPELTRISNS